jgi:DNA-directed RNA polymerase subunit RPC12/RpoP
MPIVTKYICDKCETDIPPHSSTSLQLLEQSSTGCSYTIAKIYLCSSCRKTLGVKPTPEGSHAKTTTPTPAEVIFDAISTIVADAIAEAASNANA